MFMICTPLLRACMQEKVDMKKGQMQQKVIFRGTDVQRNY
jgi:hypothetical protein